MKAPYSREPGTEWQLVKGAYHFSGTPRQCTGELALVNLSDTKVKVRSLAIAPPTRHRKDSQPLIPTEIKLAARVAPHSEARAIGALQLPSDTAPGVYQGDVICGQQLVPLEVEVLPYREVLIEPNHLRVQGASGETVSAQITLTNLGNVSVDLGDVGMIWLREHAWIGRTLVYSLREIDEHETFDQFCTRVLQNFRKDMIPSARISLEPANVSSLAAGQTLRRTLKLKLPVGIKKGRSYLGFIKINDDRIWLEVYCTGGQDALT